MRFTIKTSAFLISFLFIGFLFSPSINGGSLCAQQINADSSKPALISSIPFDLYFNLIFLQVHINGAGPFWMILDSGFEGSGINKSTLDANGWRATEPHNEAAPGGEIEVAFADSMNITLPGLALNNIKLMVISLDGLLPVIGHAIDGILGHDFFSRYTLVIDYHAERIEVFDAVRYRFAGGGQVTPVLIENNEAFIIATLESGDRSAVRAKLKIDTGSADFIGLNGSFVAHEDLFEPNHKKIPAPGAAVGGATENYVTRLAGFRLGDILIQDPVIGYSVDTLRGGDAGTIGGEFLRRFAVTFDYARHRLILKKNALFSNPCEYDMSGIFPVAEPPDFKIIKIASVGAATPASEAGLLVGDEIISIDGKPAVDYSIPQVREIFKAPGKSIRIEIQRGNEKLTVELKTKKLI
jgi:hypothetical protein